jgi:hypothetical protein
MKKFLYFATGNGANLSEEAYIAEAESISCIIPLNNTTTSVYFTKTDENKDKIAFTHDDTTATTGHRCKDIAKAIATAANSNPGVNMVSVVDLDNKVFFNNLNFVTSMDITLNL